VISTLILVFALSWPLLADVGVANQTVTVSLHAQGKVSVPGGLNLERGPQAFAPYTGVLPVSFRIRTAPGMGASITVQASGNFAPAGGPSVAAGDLTFTCSPASYGTACSGVQTVSATSQRSVVALPGAACTGGGGSCSATDPANVQLNLQLTNDPSVPTGAYTVPLVFTVSSL
jgi:hypothetical protein